MDLESEASDADDSSTEGSYDGDTTMQATDASIPMEHPHPGHDRYLSGPSQPSPSSSTDTPIMEPHDESRPRRVPQDAIYIGAPSKFPLARDEDRIDYGLVEPRVGCGQDTNLLSYGRSGSDKTAEVRKVKVEKLGLVSEIGDGGVTVFVMTPSRPVECSLSCSVAYLKREGQRKLQAMYPVASDGSHVWKPGDCGASVIEPRTGRMFGHIIFGHSGTCVAYMLPMEDILADTARTLRQDNLDCPFVPSKELVQKQKTAISTPWYRNLRSRRPETKNRSTDTKPQSCVEFASPRFHQELGAKEMPKRHQIRSFGNILRSKAAALMLPTVGKPKPIRMESFESRFFLLPPEIRDQIIRELPFRCAMNLRQVSRAWRAAVSVNESAISKRILEHNPLPALARELYPTSVVDLQYIKQIEHRHAVASKLAGHMAKWLATEIYQFRSSHQQRCFWDERRRLQRRLIPPLFTAYHFFEAYPAALLRYIRSQQQFHRPLDRSQKTVLSFEPRIMKMYNDNILLQTQEVMEVLKIFFHRMLAPPTYFGAVESLLRGYPTKAPSDATYAAILCIGGLSAVVQFADIPHHVQRRAAACQFYSALGKQGKPAPARSMTSVGDLGIMINGEGWRKNPVCAADLRGEDVHLLLEHLPPLDAIWLPAGRKVLLQRRVVEEPEKLKDFPQILTELLRPEQTLADRLYDGHLLWHALADHDYADVDEDVERR